MSISKSMFNLINYNNGEFKSSKQAAFLLSHCHEKGVFYSEGGNVYGNAYRHVEHMARKESTRSRR